MIEITSDDVLTQLRGIVAEYGGDYVYTPKALEGIGGPTCNYVDGEGGDCIVGHYLLRKGVPIERLRRADASSMGGGMNAYDMLSTLKDEGVVDFDWTSANMLGEAQRVQDAGETWGYALEVAEAEMNRN
jgi:hypothetical protein